ncbi:MAG: dynamin family protein [Syntrophobacteria bacterium]
MEHHSNSQNTLKNLLQILETLTDDLSPLFREDSAQVSSWRRSLEAVAASFKEETLRVGVVGSVKSGKSTFINALLGRDLLKRGAGIITAFITRIRSASHEKGWVEIKSWEEINSEINEALSLLGPTRDAETSGPLDLRQQEDRRILQRVVQETERHGPMKRDTFDPNMVLIDAYLKGYDTLGAHVRDERNRLEFVEEETCRHQDFVSQGSQAVYLRDMELHVPISWLGEMVEIGDCQGSDSPNPLHFAMLQEYLLGSHCILYLISSRVGIRQADLKLIEAIRILRLFPQTLFIVNIDLDEHESIEDLEHLQERVGEELSLLVPGAKIYAFSTLLHLLEAINGRGLSPREKRRLDNWYEEESLVQVSRRGYEKFCADLKHLVNRERSQVLYGGVLSHLQRVNQSMQDSLTTRQGLLSKDLEELRELADKIQTRQQSVAAAVATVEQTLKGLENSLKEHVGWAVDSYFDTHGPIIRDTMNMVEHYPVGISNHDTVGETRKWLARLYQFYQDFRQELSRYIVDKVNLRIIDFAKGEEEHIERELLQTSRGYWDLLSQALRQYQKTLKDMGLTLAFETPPTLPEAKRPALTTPAFSAFVQRSDALGRGSLLLRFGLGRVRNLFSGFRDRMLRRGTTAADSSEQLFQEAVALVKKETQKELITSFRDYRQNFKFTYLFSFIQRYTEVLVQLFRDVGDATMVDIGYLQEAARQRGTNQQETTENLAIIKHRLEYAKQQLGKLQQDLGVTIGDLHSR